jgi:ribosomal protein S16
MDQGAKPSDTVHSLLKKEGFFGAAADPNPPA